jgi:hypothetical protein
MLSILGITVFSKQDKNMGCGCSSVIQYLLSMHKALGSIPSIEKIEGKEKREKKFF